MHHDEDKSAKHEKRDQLPTRSPRSSPIRSSPIRSLDPDILQKGDLPSGWESDDFYLDKTKSKDLPLPRCITNSEWAQSKGIAGMPVHKVPLLSVLYKGIDNWTLRHLASGRLTYFVLAKSFALSQLLYNIGKNAKDIDLEVTMQAWARAQGLECTSKEDKKIATEKFAAHFVSLFRDKPISDPDLMKKITQLETELSEAKKEDRNKVHKKDGPIGDFAWSTGTTKVLSIEAPSSLSNKEVLAWSSRQIGKKDVKAFDTKLTKIKALFQTFDDDTREETAKVALIEWGLPVGLACKCGLDQALRILATLFFITK